jgi:hypothetical protein
MAKLPNTKLNMSQAEILAQPTMHGRGPARLVIHCLHLGIQSEAYLLCRQCAHTSAGVVMRKARLPRHAPSQTLQEP